MIPPPPQPGMPGAPQQPQMPQGGTGAATAPRPMMGTGQQSMTLVHTGIEALQKALVGLPMGSELHTAVLKAITDISKRMDNSQGDASSKMQALVAMAREAQNNPQAAMMQKMQMGGGQPQPPNMGQ